MEANQYTTEQLATGTRYTFSSGHVVETTAADSTASVTFPKVSGCGLVAGSVRNAGDVIDALRRNLEIPKHCKIW